MFTLNALVEAARAGEADRGFAVVAEERARTRALLLDADGLVLASSDGAGVLSERVELRTVGKTTGHHPDGTRTAGSRPTPTWAGTAPWSSPPPTEDRPTSRLRPVRGPKSRLWPPDRRPKSRLWPPRIVS